MRLQCQISVISMMCITASRCKENWWLADAAGVMFSRICWLYKQTKPL